MHHLNGISDCLITMERLFKYNVMLVMLENEMASLGTIKGRFMLNKQVFCLV